MKSKKVLIVENNDLNRKLFETLIGQIYSTEAVKNGIEAVKKASSEKYDLILMDIQMPEMDGITAMKTIRRQAMHQCPILAITSYSAETSRKLFMEMGFDDMIIKPIRPKEFLTFITSKIDIESEESSTFAAVSEANDVLDRLVFDQLLKYNNLDTIRSIYIDFLDEFDQLIYPIDVAFQEKNLQILLESLHTLKGNSGTLGATAIYILSHEADKNTRSQDWDSLETTLKKLKNERIKFETYLKEETTFKQ
ncbi:Hpt domain-containing protein [Algoriphagus ratkowskyi]|uniref:Hpt domain-containing protein n=1 Tax=Algoriphagus ratkowskyi TaxID=57028 RepID=A0A2W7RLF0_9BACT|nr:response regulator [Algoriphagus ratkowskyi]PZX61214.1 Hpt domain-containing protein [Algoriphagus ratkowskyi]TXD79332.1 response regulator [Algoriphagus ratkowskyi]